MGRNRYRELFFAIHGPGPYICFDCKEEVEFDEVHIHHLDSDHKNDAVENLAPAHDACHQRYHGRVRVQSEETRTKRRATWKMKWTQGYEFPEHQREGLRRAAIRRRRESKSGRFV